MGSDARQSCFDIRAHRISCSLGHEIAVGCIFATVGGLGLSFLETTSHAHKCKNEKSSKMYTEQQDHIIVIE